MGSPTTVSPPTHHALVSVFQAGECRGWRVLDLEHDYRPLIKQLAWQTVARRPALAGCPFVLSARVAEARPAGIVLEALPAPRQRRSAGPMGALFVPVETFAWVASSVASTLGLSGDVTWQLSLLEPGHRLIKQWHRDGEGDDFEVLSRRPAQLALPRAFRTAGASAGSRADEAGGTWLRCVLRKDVYESLVRMAAAETQVERGWLACGGVRLRGGGADVVIDELVEPPAAERGAAFLVTTGADFLRLHSSLAGRIVGYVHLHPPELDGKPLAPAPSANDAVLAWDFDRAVTAPSVFPIGIFGPDAARAGFAAWGYDTGLLSRIPLEVDYA